MDFHCDRCGTRYSTTQSVRESRAYTYRCRVCTQTIFVRAPAEEPAGRGHVPATPRGDVAGAAGRGGPANGHANGHAGGHANGATRTAPAKGAVNGHANGSAPGARHGGASRAAIDDRVREGAVTTIHGLAGEETARRERRPRRAASSDHATFIVNPTDLPPPEGGYIDLSFDDDVPGTSGGGGVGVVTGPAFTPALVQPAVVRKPAIASPELRAPASYRPADGPNRSGRVDVTSPLPLSLPRVPAPDVEAPAQEGPRRWTKLTKGQRLAATVAVFGGITLVSLVIGVVLAARSVPPATAASAKARHAARAADPSPAIAAPPVPAAALAAPAPAGARTPTAAPPPRREPPPAAASALVAVPPVQRIPAAPVPPPARKGIATRPPRQTGQLPRRDARATRGAKVASAPPIQRASWTPPRAAEPDPVAPAPRESRAAGREDEPIAARPGYRQPSAVKPGCVQHGVRIPSRFRDRLPGSVIVRFAVGRNGSADLIQMQPGPDRARGERVEPELADALTAAVKACRFSPGTDDHGRPVRMWSVMKVQFGG